MVELKAFDAAEYLDDAEAISHYLEDALADSDPREFLIALGVVARAKGMTQLARDVGVTRPALYRSLEASGHPEFHTIAKVMRAIGVSLHVAPLVAPQAPKRKKGAATPAEA